MSFKFINYFEFFITSSKGTFIETAHKMFIENEPVTENTVTNQALNFNCFVHGCHASLEMIVIYGGEC